MSLSSLGCTPKPCLKNTKHKHRKPNSSPSRACASGFQLGSVLDSSHCSQSTEKAEQHSVLPLDKLRRGE